MRLTLTLLKRKMPPGFIWTGKHRLGHNVYAQNIERFVKKLKIEEQNMFLLRNPYLTVEQEYGHAIPLKKREAWMNNKILALAAKKVIKSTKIEDKLHHLHDSQSWEL